jgi:hypothetical protein
MYPLVVMAYNRPDYLKRVLISIKRSFDHVFPGGDYSNVYLFLDGPKNSSISSLSDECAEVFANLFPLSQIYRSSKNIGILNNYTRAEKFVFEELNSDFAYFFEDDLVVGLDYFNVLLHYVNLMKIYPRIAYAACYGENSYPNFIRSSDAITSPDTLGHHWGFVASRVSYFAIKNHLAKYSEIIGGSSYSDKEDHRFEIEALFRNLGSNFKEISQDCMKSIALISEGYIKINSNFNLGFNIGKIGEHMNTSLSQRLNWVEGSLDESPGYIEISEKDIDTIHSFLYGIFKFE